MKIDQLLVEMICQSRALDHSPREILLGNYMLDELKSQIKEVITLCASNKGDLEFYGIKIKVNYEYPFFIGMY